MPSLDSIELYFPHGLPGFETATRFRIKEQASFAPVVFLTALDVEDLCFLVLPVERIDPDYSLAVNAEDLRTLSLDGSRQPSLSGDVLCLVILTAPEQGPLTANLLAPIVINLPARLAVQAVRADARYSHQHLIAAPTTEEATQEATEEATEETC